MLYRTLVLRVCLRGSMLTDKHPSLTKDVLTNCIRGEQSDGLKARLDPLRIEEATRARVTP